MNDFKWRHFRGEMILWAVRWYCSYGISYRELEDMLKERGFEVDHSTIHRWVLAYAPELEKRLRYYYTPSCFGHDSWRVDGHCRKKQFALIFLFVLSLRLFDFGGDD